MDLKHYRAVEKVSKIRFFVPGTFDPVLYKVGSAGFVTLIDYMGDEPAILDAARTSYGRESKSRRMNDVSLLRYLLRHRHTTPFEMCEVKFLIRIPMDIWRQMVRHRTANINEYSTRYKEAIEDIAWTMPGQWRLQAVENKQGSDGYLADKDLEIAQTLSEDERALHEHIRQVYAARVTHGVALEQARKDLSLSNYTEVVWKCDLHNFMHFLKLRLDTHAQLEIREFAAAMRAFAEIIWPNVFKAFDNYILYAKTFSQTELNILRNFISLLPNDEKTTLLRLIGEDVQTKQLTDREAKEFVAALECKFRP